MKKLDNVKGIISFGNWMVDQGYTVGQGPGKFGPVDPNAHVPTSLHYEGLAYDVNYGSSGPEENEKLRHLYMHIIRYKREHPQWPLDEMFFNGLGFIKELGPDVNHPITNHETHLHIGFMRKRPWT